MQNHNKQGQQLHAAGTYGGMRIEETDRWRGMSDLVQAGSDLNRAAASAMKATFANLVRVGHQKLHPLKAIVGDSTKARAALGAADTAAGKVAHVWGEEKF